MELNSYLIIPADMNYLVSAKSRTLQVNLFTNGEGEYDKLMMETAKKLKRDNLLSKRQDNLRGPDGCCMQMSFQPVRCEFEGREEKETKPEQETQRKHTGPKQDKRSTECQLQIYVTNYAGELPSKID